MVLKTLRRTRFFKCELVDICNKTWGEKRSSRYRLRVLNTTDFRDETKNMRQGIFHSYSYITGKVIYLDGFKMNGIKLKRNKKYVIQCSISEDSHKFYIDKVVSVSEIM